MNICKNCQFSDFKGPIWYDQFCKHPKVLKKEGICPQTGKKGFVSGNAMGNIFIDDQQFPYARDINKMGECKLFKEKDNYDVFSEIKGFLNN